MSKQVFNFIVIFLVFTQISQSSFAADPSSTPTATPQQHAEFTGSNSAGVDPSDKPKDSGILQFNRNLNKEYETGRAIDNQNRVFETGNGTTVNVQKNIDEGNSRAQQMMTMLKDEQMKKAMEKVTGVGNQILKDNKPLQTPAAVIAGAFGFWYGRTINLIRGDGYKVTSSVEGKSHSGGLGMDSPLLNGKLRFSQTDGMDLSVNRRISSIDTSAELKYNSKNQALTTQMRHNLLPHVDLTFGSQMSPTLPQTDNRAGIEYRISF